MKKDYQKVLETFILLDLEEKKKELLKVLKVLHNVSNIFLSLTKLIESNNVDNNFLEKIYSKVLKIEEENNQKKKGEMISSLEQIKDKVNKIKQKEIEENNNSDNILQELENL